MYETVMLEDGADIGSLNLDSMQPGVMLAAMLSSIDVHALSGYDRIIVLRAQQRMASHYAAQVHDAMTAVVDVIDADDPQWAQEAAAAEIAAALRLTRRAADTELSFALDLKQRLPQVWSALTTGRIDVRRAKTIIRGTDHLSLANAREVIDQVMVDAAELTTGQLAARIRRVCMEADPADAVRRYDEAVRERRIATEPTTSGTSNLLGMDLPPHRLAAGMRHVNQLAKSLKTKHEQRSIDQLRADVLLDLLEGTGTPTRSGRGTVDIHVDLNTLAELADNPAELAGYGPVIADIARQVARTQATSEMRFTVTEPGTGDIVRAGTTRYRPTTQEQREVHARYRTCIHPGCRMPAIDSDLDHRIPHAEGGPTAVSNLAPLCRHHHVVRHRHGWRYRRLPNGNHEWTSRLGHLYTTRSRSP